MNKTEELPKYMFAPYLPITTGTIINGVRVSDHRWWGNILCKIKWFFRFKERKRLKRLTNLKVNPKFYGIINCELYNKIN